MKAQEFQAKLDAVARMGLAGKQAVTPSSLSVYGKEDDEVSARRPNKKGNARKLPKAKRKRNRQLRGF